MARSFGALWERITSLENLFAAAEEAMQGKRCTGAAARSFARWEEECVRLRLALRDESWRHGPYTYFTISDLKERVVSAATFRDRVAHHAADAGARAAAGSNAGGGHLRVPPG